MSDPTDTQPCPGPGPHTETTNDDGIHRETWHACPVCHGDH